MSAWVVVNPSPVHSWGAALFKDGILHVEGAYDTLVLCATALNEREGARTPDPAARVGALVALGEKWRWFLKDGETYHAAFLADLAAIARAERGTP